MNVLHNDKIIELLKSCYITEKLWIFTLFLLGASLHCSSHVFNLFWFSHPKSMGHTGLQNTHIACHQFFFWKGFTLKKNAYYWAMDSSHRFAKSVFFLPKLIWSSYSRNEGSQSWGRHPKIISTMSTFDAKTFDKEGVKIILVFLWLCTKSFPSHYPLLHLGHPKSFFAEKSAF